MPVNVSRSGLWRSLMRIAGRLPLMCTHTCTSPSTSRSGAPSPSLLIAPPANGFSSSSVTLTPGSSRTLTRPPSESTTVPTRGGAEPGRTTSLAGSEPMVVSAFVRNARPAMVSHPVSDVSFVSSPRRYCSSSARQPVAVTSGVDVGGGGSAGRSQAPPAKTASSTAQRAFITSSYHLLRTTYHLPPATRLVLGSPRHAAQTLFAAALPRHPVGLRP